jgi:hypothetical protein
MKRRLSIVNTLIYDSGVDDGTSSRAPATWRRLSLSATSLTSFS